MGEGGREKGCVTYWWLPSGGVGAVSSCLGCQVGGGLTSQEVGGGAPGIPPGLRNW